MKEILEYEDIIRRALPNARAPRHADAAPVKLVANALAIMQGRPLPHVTVGATRKERLRYIAEQMAPYLPAEPVAAQNVKVTFTSDHAATFRAAAAILRETADHDDDMFEDDEGECPHNKRGHHFVIQEGFDIIGEGRSYCEWCGADGDA